MLGLITLDLGNTNPHAGLFQKTVDQWSLVKTVPLNKLAIYLNQLGINAGNSSVVLCEVKNQEIEVQKLQEQGFLVTRIKDYWKGLKFAGMPVNYANSLGEDRLVVAFNAFKKNQRPTLIIDAGTFVTMDVVTEKGFIGGYIIPGTKAYFDAYVKGERLKNIPLNLSFSTELPNETSAAMTDSYTAFAALAKNLITEYKIQQITLTGGQAVLWENLFKDLQASIVIESHPHLIHWSLHYWMTTQIEPL